MKRKAFGLKIISFFLSVVVTVACLPATANSLNTNAVDVSTEVVEPTITDPVIIDPIFEEAKIESATLEQLTSRAPDEKTVFELQEMEVDTSSLPSFIETNYALQKGHVNRLKSAEKNLNTVVFQNKDGTETTYIFIRPVKYVDENGEVKDKSDKIAPIIHATYSYGVLNNNSKIYFPKNVTAGTKIQYQNYTIQMTPVTTYSASPTYLNETEVAYNGVFGTNTVLKYQTKLNGLKEDIVLVKNTGLNEFDFTLTLTNLTPVLIDNIWYLKNSGDEIIASLGRIIIKDSNGNSTEGSMTISPSTARNTYAVKIIVPADFLSADSTVYPVYVDPSTTIFETNSYYNEYGYLCSYNAILDTGMYTTAEAVVNAEANQDYHNSSITGKIVYKLYDFYGENGQFTTLRSSQIGNAFLHINVGSGASATLTVNPMLGTWNQETYGEDPIAISDFMIWMAYSTEISSSLYLDSTGGQRSINITDIVRGWADYNNGESSVPYNNPEYGFVLSSDLTSSSRTITAVEEFYANSVYVTLDTSSWGGEYYINNILTGRFLRRSSSTTVSTGKHYSSQSFKWSFEYIGNNKFIIRSMYNLNYVLRGSGSDVVLAYLPTNPTDDYIWYVKTSEVGGVTIQNVQSLKMLRYDKAADEDDNSSTKSLTLVQPMTSNHSNYEQIVWGIIETTSYVNLSSFSVTIPDWLSIRSEINAQLAIVPANATWISRTNFYWKSSNTNVATIDKYGRITTTGDGYTNIIVTHKPTEKSYTIPVVVGRLFSNDTYTYHIENVYSGKYINIGTRPTEGASIQQRDRSVEEQAMWDITFCELGYYYITSAFNGKYICASEASSSDGTSIIQTSTQSEACKWKLLITDEGNYKFVSKVSGKVISLPNQTTANETNLKQLAYTDDVIYTDEWIINCWRDVAFISLPESYDRTSFFASALSELGALGYIVNVYSKQASMNHTHVLDFMEKTKITVIRTHGNQTIIETSKREISTSTMELLAEDTLSYSQLIIYGACKTGKGRNAEVNLVNSTHSAGAATVIGFENSMRSSEMDAWCEGFFIAIADGKNIIEACEAAVEYVEEHWYDPNQPERTINTNTWYIAGDGNTLLV